MNDVTIERTALAVTFYVEGSEDGSLPSYRDTLHIEMPDGTTVADAEKQIDGLIAERHGNWSEHILNPPVVETVVPSKDEALEQAKEALEQAQQAVTALIVSQEQTDPKK